MQIYYRHTLKEDSPNNTEFAISHLAIDKPNNRSYIVCYHNVNYNPKEGKLCLDETLRFNKTFILKKLTEYGASRDDAKASLLQYIF